METMNIRKFQGRTSEAVRVLAFFKAKPGKREELETVLKSLIAPTRSEPGNIAYMMHRSTNNADELMFDEIWADMKSLQDHLKMPHMLSALPKIKEMLDAPLRIETYYEISSDKNHV